MQNKTFIIDICGTMFKSNTTFDFIRYYYGSSLIVKFWFSLPYRLYNRLMFHFFKKEPLRRNLISKLYGKTKDQLAGMAMEFCRKFLCGQENEQVLRIINDKRAEGYRLVIVSATIDVIAHAVASCYDIPECISTTLEYDTEGVCNGRIDKDLLSCKKIMLESMGLMPPYAGVLTDNYSDCDIIRESQEAYLVIYKRGKNKLATVASKYNLKSCRIIEV